MNASPARWMANATRAALDPKNDDFGTDGHVAFRLWAMAEGSPVVVYVVGVDTEGGYAPPQTVSMHFRRSVARAECAALIRRERAREGYCRKGHFSVRSFNVFP